MNKYFLFILIVMCITTLIGAENVGLYEVDKEMQITNYCVIGDCTYITLISLEMPNGTIIYPNTNMTMNEKVYNYSYTPTQIGQYTFVTCGDSITNVCDSDTFDVSFTGKETFVGINIILLLFFSSLLIIVAYLNKTTNYNKMYTGLMEKYKYKNYFKFSLSMVWYNLIKNSFGLYYLIGFPIMTIITDIVLTYNVISLTGFIEVAMYCYAWGVLLIGLMIGGQLQEFIATIVEDIKNQNWGFTE